MLQVVDRSTVVNVLQDRSVFVFRVKHTPCSFLSYNIHKPFENKKKSTFISYLTENKICFQQKDQLVGTL